MPITVVLLAAGYATRLYPLTKDRPKTLLPFAGHTILDEILQSFPSIPDLRKCVLITNHRFAEQFRDWQRTHHADIEIVDDQTDSPETRLGAIRDLELARRATDPTNDLLVVGTDNLFHWSLADFVGHAQRHRPQPSLALWGAPSKKVATQFGVVVRDRTSRITAFVEKSAHPPSKEVALCVYYFPAPMCGLISQFVEAGGNVDAPGYFIEWLVRVGAVYGVMMPGTWYDIGTLEAYQAAVKEWQRTT